MVRVDRRSENMTEEYSTALENSKGVLEYVGCMSMQLALMARREGNERLASLLDLAADLAADKIHLPRR